MSKQQAKHSADQALVEDKSPEGIKEKTRNKCCSESHDECLRREEAYKEQYLRSLADYQNLLKRVAKEREAFINSASEGIILRLLPIVDDLARAVASLEETGIKLIYNKVLEILKSEQVERIAIKETDAFDPTRMECIEAEQDGKKLIEVRAGYTMRGKLLRPTQVKVVQ